MKNIINLLVAGSLLGCTNNVEVVSYEKSKELNPKNTRQIPTSYGIFELKKYEKGSEIAPIGSLNPIKPLRDIDGDWKPDEVKYNESWATIEKEDEKKFGEIYKSVHSNVN